MKKLLMHSCCGPCSIYPINFFMSDPQFANGGCEVTSYYFNPNIHPEDEHIRRGKALRKVVYNAGANIIYSDAFAQNEWESFTGSEEERCTRCYRLRLEETAMAASKEGFDAFTTSLLISPYQKHEMIKEICEEAERNMGVEFLYYDFRPHFREGQRMARELGIYMQKYCGCINSINN